jgi:hypothetical protein
VLVRDEIDFGAAVAADILGIPAATVVVIAAGAFVRSDLLSDRLLELRQECGLINPPGPTGRTGNSLSPQSHPASATQAVRCHSPRTTSVLRCWIPPSQSPRASPTTVLNVTARRCT